MGVRELSCGFESAPVLLVSGFAVVWGYSFIRRVKISFEWCLL